MRKTHYSSIALLLAVNLLIGPQFINTASGAEVEQDFDDDGVVEDLQVSGKVTVTLRINCLLSLFHC